MASKCTGILCSFVIGVSNPHLYSAWRDGKVGMGVGTAR